MRAFVPRSLAFVLAGFAALLSSPTYAQGGASGEPPEEVTVRGRKTMTQYRLELERARDNIFKVFNEANEGSDTDVRCSKERPTGSRVPQTVCRSDAENKAHAEAGRRMLNSLLFSAQGSFAKLGFGGPSPTSYSNISTANAEEAGKVGEGDALAEFEKEFIRVLSENRDLYRAVSTYAELENEYILARGDTPVDARPEVAVVLEEALPQTAGPQCEASTLTEFQQRNNIARVSGKVSISMCPAGTTGSFTLVARVRNDAGEIKPIEFNETWQRADAEDHAFNADYPIGDNVELMSVRVRALQCSCAAPP